MNNPLKSCGIEFHILQSFPVTCLNRDDVGAPKSAIVGGVPRARVSSQCWKRQVRLALRDLGVQLGIRTKRVAELLRPELEARGATPEQAEECARVMASVLTRDTLLFISTGEVARLADYAAGLGFVLPTWKKAKKRKDTEEDEDSVGSMSKAEAAKLLKCLDGDNKALDGLDIALFGRMVAQGRKADVDVDIRAAASFAHAISTHRAVNEVEFFTALDDNPGPEDAGSAHMGALEYNAATYYRYVSLDLGQLWDNLGGEDMDKAVQAFVKALYVAVPQARQNTQSGACLWDYARVLVRKGQRMQVCFDKPVSAKGQGWLEPSKVALNEALERNERLSGSLYGKRAEFTFGEDTSFNIDQLCAEVVQAVRALEGQA